MAEISLVSSKHVNKTNCRGWREMGRALVLGMAGAFCLTAAAGPLDGVFRSGSQYSSKDWTFVTLGGEDFAFITPQSFILSSQKESDFHQKMVGLNKAVYTVLKNNHWAR